MKHLNGRVTRFFVSAVMIALILLTGWSVSWAEEIEVSKVVFYVG